MSDLKDGPMVAGEQAHTPGPWRLVVGDDYHIQADAYPTKYPHRFKGDDTGPHLATVYYIATAGNRTEDFGEANARLIAAAPDLSDVARAYEAWEADVILNADWRSEAPRLTQAQWDRFVEIQAMRNAALAKAEGRTNA